MAGIRLSTIVAAELVAAALLLATDVPVVWGVVLVALAVAVALAVVLPVAGLRMAGWAAILLGFATRRRVLTADPAATAPADDRAGRDRAGRDRAGLPPEVRAFFPGVDVTEEVTHGAGRIALVQWNGTWSSVVALTPPAAEVLTVGAVPRLPVGRIVAGLAGHGLALDAAVVTTQTLYGDPDRFGGGILPAVAGELGSSGGIVRGREAWVTVRIEPVAAGAAIAARGGGFTGLARLAAAAVSRVVSEAYGAGIGAEPLGAEAVGRAMSAALLQPHAAEGTRPRWIESLTSVSSAEVHHRCFVVTAWHDRALDDAGFGTGYGLTVSHEVRGFAATDDLEVRTVLRLSAPTASQLDRATARLRRACRSAGIGIRPLRGQQAAAMRLSIPAGQR